MDSTATAEAREGIDKVELPASQAEVHLVHGSQEEDLLQGHDRLHIIQVAMATTAVPELCLTDRIRSQSKKSFLAHPLD